MADDGRDLQQEYDDAVLQRDDACREAIPDITAEVVQSVFFHSAFEVVGHALELGFVASSFAGIVFESSIAVPDAGEAQKKFECDQFKSKLEMLEQEKNIEQGLPLYLNTETRKSIAEKQFTNQQNQKKIDLLNGTCNDLFRVLYPTKCYILSNPVDRHAIDSATADNVSNVKEAMLKYKHA